MRGDRFKAPAGKARTKEKRPSEFPRWGVCLVSGLSYALYCSQSRSFKPN
jgi:hypothetical protein